MAPHDTDFIGPIPYGAVAVDGKLYPEFSQEITRYETDYLRETVLNAEMIVKALKAVVGNEHVRFTIEDLDRMDALAQKLELLHEELVGEGSLDFWEAK